MNISPGEFLSGEIDGFRPELDAYLVWLVEWSHELHIGRSVWEEGEIKPHSVNVGEVNVGEVNVGEVNVGEVNVGEVNVGK